MILVKPHPHNTGISTKICKYSILPATYGTWKSGNNKGTLYQQASNLRYIVDFDDSRCCIKILKRIKDTSTMNVTP